MAWTRREVNLVVLSTGITFLFFLLMSRQGLVPTQVTGGQNSVQDRSQDRQVERSPERKVDTAERPGESEPEGKAVIENNVCRKGTPLFTHQELIEELPNFIRVYNSRIGTNRQGTGVHHQFALWCILRKIKPKHIIESGVHRGLGTWIMRQAAPQAQFIEIDPHPQRLEYQDTRNDTIYLTHSKFRDFGSIDFKKEFKIDAENTLAFIDDHRHAVARTIQAFQKGFGHMIFDDNFASGRNDRPIDNYSLKIACEVALGVLPEGRKVRHFVIDGQRMMDAKYIFNDVIETYYEFPAIYKPWNSDNSLFPDTDWKKFFTEKYPMSKPPEFIYNRLYVFIAYVKLRN